MNLKSFGCSFIFGTDLADDGSGEPYTKSSQLTWPALLAKDLGFEYCCYARPGSGNLRILEKVLTQASDSTSNNLFVIGWTWIDRFDYTVDSTGRDHLYDLANCNLWRTVMPVDTDARAKNYYRDLHSQYRDKLASLTYIQTAVSMLQTRKIPFVMTYMDELLFETQWHANPAIVELQNSIRPYMTKFEDQTFLDWSKKQGFPISKTLHPLEDAHQAAFELIRPKVDTILHKA
jgi:hypothetical protein